MSVPNHPDIATSEDHQSASPTRTHSPVPIEELSHSATASASVSATDTYRDSIDFCDTTESNSPASADAPQDILSESHNLQDNLSSTDPSHHMLLDSLVPPTLATQHHKALQQSSSSPSEPVPIPTPTPSKSSEFTITPKPSPPTILSIMHKQAPKSRLSFLESIFSPNAPVSSPSAPPNTPTTPAPPKSSPMTGSTFTLTPAQRFLLQGSLTARVPVDDGKENKPSAEVLKIQTESPGKEGEEMNAFEPRVDHVDTPADVFLIVDVPGAKTDDITVEIGDDSNEIVVRGFIEEPVRTNSTYHNRERHTGAFSRRIQFMCPVVSAQAGASVFNGVLTVRVPKQMH